MEDHDSTEENNLGTVLVKGVLIKATNTGVTNALTVQIRSFGRQLWQVGIYDP